VQAFASSHVVPFAFGGFEQTPLEVLQTPTSWHWSSAVQITGLLPVHTPDWQASVCVQALPSLQLVPFALGVTVQLDVPLQIRVLHWSSAQVIDVPPHVPAVHTSL
jgi:hypothetical protein